MQSVTGKRKRRGAMGAMAVKRMVAFVQGSEVQHVVMVSGVQVLAGVKRTRDDEPKRAEQRGPQEQHQRQDAEQDEEQQPLSARAVRARRRATVENGREREREENGREVNRGSGPGGLGDRVGVG